MLYNDQSNDSTFIDVNNLSFNENIKSIPENLKEVFWVPLYYYEQINDKKDRNSILFMNEPFWNNWKSQTESRIYNTWQDDFFLGYYRFNAFYLFARCSQFGMDEAIFLVKTENVSTNQVEYKVCKMYTHFIAYNERTSNPQYKFLPLYQKATPFKIILIIDGDYMKMYIDEVSEKNLFQTLIRTSPEACNQIENWIKGKSNDLSKVVMPKHGNASVQTEVTKTNTTTVSPAQTMTVTENLKLRSGEATSTKVLSVMAAGTKVKILEVGKSEAIDGIKSNWVKVEVQKNTKDRDGKAIKAGTVGWCYGGYLK